MRRQLRAMWLAATGRLASADVQVEEKMPSRQSVWRIVVPRAALRKRSDATALGMEPGDGDVRWTRHLLLEKELESSELGWHVQALATDGTAVSITYERPALPFEEKRKETAKSKRWTRTALGKAIAGAGISATLDQLKHDAEATDNDKHASPHGVYAQMEPKHFFYTHAEQADKLRECKQEDDDSAELRKFKG